MSIEIKVPKKLIEVALPLDDINASGAHEKQPGIGAHPRGLHLWWARRPFAPARAIIFAQMVNDPGFDRKLSFGLNKEKAREERERLFRIIRRLVSWENFNNEVVLNEAYQEILKSWKAVCDLNKLHPQAKELFNPDSLPPFHDPFAGGGALPLEAQKLRLLSRASDLNPVAVLINKSMIEIPPLFANKKSTVKNSSELLQDLPESSIRGLLNDISIYGSMVLDRCRKKLSIFYPEVLITKEHAKIHSDLSSLVGKNVSVLTWIWARTVPSPNPAFSSINVPLISNYVLCSKAGRQVFLKPRIDGRSYAFDIVYGDPPEGLESGTKAGRGSFRCLFSDVPITGEYIKDQAVKGNLGTKLLASIVQVGRKRFYLPADSKSETIAIQVPEASVGDLSFSGTSQYLGVLPYGLNNISKIFTKRQLLSLDTFINEIMEIKKEIKTNALASGFAADGKKLEIGGLGAEAYSEAVALYLMFAVSRMADYNSSLATWKPSGEQVMQTFKRQALAMTWDFPESNILMDRSICWINSVKYTVENLNATYCEGVSRGEVRQIDAKTQSLSCNAVISTDPPYYDNIPYADLSDFFYFWLRKGLKNDFPELFSTISTPKSNELVAFSYRHKSKEDAEKFFMSGMTEAIQRIVENSHPAFPITIYYAFKQSETEGDNTSSSGWETFLQALINSKIQIVGTWPVRTESSSRIRGAESNALASSIVLVCKLRNANAGVVSRRDFIRELSTILPDSIEEMTVGGDQSPVAPVDLSQAIIGPGMAIFSKYSAVIEADGQPMTVKAALQLINRFLAEDDFDHDTQFCLSWFEANGWTEGLFGQADVLARAKGTSVEGLKDGGVANSSAGKFSLIKWQDLDEDWSPEKDNRISHWEMLHHLIRAYNKNGENSAGEILARIHSKSETIRALAYRLYTLCERKKYADDAANYNNLILAWEAIEMAAQSVGVKDTQISLFDNEQETKETNKKTKRKKQ